jgi:hypothetical protein
MRNNVTKLAVALATAMGWLAFNAVPALAQYRQINLTGYQPGMGRFLDPELNGWVMLSLDNGSFCVANFLLWRVMMGWRWARTAGGNLNP